eukprot:354975-Pleurochrysis_carterae.AAC.1
MQWGVLRIHTSATASVEASDSIYLEAHERGLVLALVDREHTRRVASVPHPILSERDSYAPRT